ncbi:hypothetical protein VN97_g12651, partial [Penicillium thymicola]
MDLPMPIHMDFTSILSLRFTNLISPVPTTLPKPSFVRLSRYCPYSSHSSPIPTPKRPSQNPILCLSTAFPSPSPTYPTLKSRSFSIPTAPLPSL